MRINPRLLANSPSYMPLCRLPVAMARSVGEVQGSSPTGSSSSWILIVEADLGRNELEGGLKETILPWSWENKTSIVLLSGLLGASGEVCAAPSREGKVKERCTPGWDKEADEAMIKAEAAA